MSDVLDAENAGAAVRWELPRLGAESRAGGGVPPTARHLDDLERSAWAEGFERGRAEGYAAGMAAAQVDAAQLRRILDHFARPLRELGDELEQMVVNLATAVAGALTRVRSAHEPEVVAALVREALAALPAASREVELQLHPEDLAALEPLLRERDPALRLTATGQLARGDVRVHSDLVRLDATLTTRLANAAEALLSKP
jgi:flagellar assembly protein FliH